MHIENCTFFNNRVQSLELDLQCNNNDLPSESPSELILRSNLFSQNSQTVASLAVANCVRAQLDSNQFLDNNLDGRYGALKLVLNPAAGQREKFAVTLTENNFTRNTGEFAVYIFPVNPNAFVGALNGNQFLMNENRKATLVAGSPLLNVRFNQFVDPQARFELEVDYNDDRVLDAAQRRA